MIPFNILLKFIDIAKRLSSGDEAVNEGWTAHFTSQGVELLNPLGIVQCKFAQKGEMYAENQPGRPIGQ